jgi:hypothetical protein
MAFDLHTVVNEVFDSTSATDPRDIAAEVAQLVPDEDLRLALTDALEVYVRLTITRRRTTNAIVGVTSYNSAAPHPVSAQRPSRDSLSGGTQPQTTATKQGAIRDRWAQALRDLVHVEGEYKTLGECTYDDLMFAVAERRKLATQNNAAADRYERLAGVLAKHAVITVAELPREALDMSEGEVTAAV